MLLRFVYEIHMITEGDERLRVKECRKFSTRTGLCNLYLNLPKWARFLTFL